MTQNEFVVVLVTVGSRLEGDTIAHRLVEEGLAACVTVAGPIRSVYIWKGAVTEEEEHLLIIKSREAMYSAIEARVRALHSYEVPEVIALPIVAGSPPYLDWIQAGTSSTPSRS